MLEGLFKDRYHDYANDDEAREFEREIVSKLAEGELYVDPTFAADGAALYADPASPPKGALSPDNVDWLRVNSNEIKGMPEPETFKSGIGAGDVIQGALGDCWFISAMSILATRPELLDNVIVSDKNKARGIYTLKYFKAGQWRYVHIDDRLPCTKGGKVYYARCKDMNETWVPLMEKAYAKIHGCYANLASGFIDFGLADMIGGACMKIKWADKSTKAMIKNDELWPFLKAYKDEGSLMGCSKKGGVEHANDLGILSGHAYGILKMEECDIAGKDADECRFVQARNPWGKREWVGAWCDKDQHWEDYPAVKEQLNPSFGDDGTFWMNWKDFMEQFDQVFLCMDFPDTWEGRGFKGEWKSGDEVSGAGGMPKFKSFPNNPQYTFTCTEATKVVAIVSQPDLRWTKCVPEYKDAIGFVLMELKGESNKRIAKFTPKAMRGMSRTFAPSRDIAGVINELKPGRYAIIPCTFQPNVTVPFMLQLYTSTKVEYDQEGDDLPDLDELEVETDDEDDWEDAPEEDDVGDQAEPEQEGLELKALMEQVSDLAGLIKGLTSDVEGLESKVTKLEGEGEN